MPFWGRKRTASIDSFCREFYDEEVFGSPAAKDGRERKAWWEEAFDALTDISPSLAAVDKPLFRKEVIALRMELFAIAWLDQFERGQPVIPQGDVTKRYLGEREMDDIWARMGKYNEALKVAAPARDAGRPIDEKKHHAQERSRSDLIATWSRKGFDPESIERVANRLGARLEPSSDALRQLALTLLARLGAGDSPSTEETTRTSALILGWYKEIREALGRISLREDISARWFW